MWYQLIGNATYECRQSDPDIVSHIHEEFEAVNVDEALAVMSKLLVKKKYAKLDSGKLLPESPWESLYAELREFKKLVEVRLEEALPAVPARPQQIIPATPAMEALPTRIELRRL